MILCVTQVWSYSAINKPKAVLQRLSVLQGSVCVHSTAILMCRIYIYTGQECVHAQDWDSVNKPLHHTAPPRVSQHFSDHKHLTGNPENIQLTFSDTNKHISIRLPPCNHGRLKGKYCGKSFIYLFYLQNTKLKTPLLTIDCRHLTFFNINKRLNARARPVYGC